MYTPEEKNILEQAAAIQKSKALLNKVEFSNADFAGSYISNEIAHYEQEVFFVVFLNSQHFLIESEIMFKGTINASAIYPREIIKRALSLNASALILAHNHPSGVTTPSQSDKEVTYSIQRACQLLDISLLDHFIVGSDVLSFAKTGLL
tara:strand:+ start:74 stop:520 length:447 start_codon:yes stop_codon:yes gene_type:complete